MQSLAIKTWVFGSPRGALRGVLGVDWLLHIAVSAPKLWLAMIDPHPKLLLGTL